MLLKLRSFNYAVSTEIELKIHSKATVEHYVNMFASCFCVLFVVYLTALSVTVNNDLVRMLKEAVMAYFKFSLNLPGGMKENHKGPQDRRRAGRDF
jgi:hypothetical protein